MAHVTINGQRIRLNNENGYYSYTFTAGDNQNIDIEQICDLGGTELSEISLREYDDSFTTNPIGAEYIGVAVTNSEDPPPNKNDYKWTLIKGEKGDKGDTGEADYTVFRSEYSSELNVLQNSINSKVSQIDYNRNNQFLNEKFTQIEQTAEEIVSSVSDNAFERLKGLEEEIIEKLGSKLSQEEIQELIDGLENQIEGVSSRITQTNDSFTQEYSRIEASIENNKAELEKLSGVIQSGLDENGNTYTDWIGDDENRVRVGSDGIVMLSNNAETLKLKDGRGYMNSLYVEHELGLGNHTARKMGTEFTVFMPIGGQK